MNTRWLVTQNGAYINIAHIAILELDPDLCISACINQHNHQYRGYQVATFPNPEDAGRALHALMMEIVNGKEPFIHCHEGYAP